MQLESSVNQSSRLTRHTTTTPFVWTSHHLTHTITRLCEGSYFYRHFMASPRTLAILYLFYSALLSTQPNVASIITNSALCIGNWKFCRRRSLGFFCSGIPCGLSGTEFSVSLGPEEWTSFQCREIESVATHTSHRTRCSISAVSSDFTNFMFFFFFLLNYSTFLLVFGSWWPSNWMITEKLIAEKENSKWSNFISLVCICVSWCRCDTLFWPIFFPTIHCVFVCSRECMTVKNKVQRFIWLSDFNW